MADARPKKNKTSFKSRIIERGRETRNLAVILKNEPRRFPRELLGIAKRSLRTVWDARGGGLYACGFVVTLVYLEVRMFFSEILNADGVANFFTEQLAGMFFRFLGDSIENFIGAFIWPVYVIEIMPPWGAVFLVIMYFVFPALLKKPLERWLFDEDDTTLKAE